MYLFTQAASFAQKHAYGHIYSADVAVFRQVRFTATDVVAGFIMKAWCHKSS